MTNAAKYAKASRVWVSIGIAADALTVEVTDDGIGGAIPAPDSGLVGLRDRLDVLGGTLSVVSLPQHGTTVLATLPRAHRELAAGIDHGDKTS